ncbi:MAG: hypothetical protein E7289_02085 [Lachnospiraceae bacterium]|nr:hypothetical protein [Lachnospiraceae bacterium]
MKKIKIKKWKANIILPMLTLFFLAGFIGSYIFPNTVLDTFVINMAEEEDDTEVLLPLSLQTPIEYKMNTKGLPMQGIQVGINKRGHALTKTNLIYTVYAGEECISHNVYEVATGDDLQYVYLPFENHEKCIGDVRITFVLDAAEEDPDAYPALMANHAEIEGTSTIAPVRPEGEEDTEVSLKCNYIYTHDTYPFLYDCRLLTFVFLAASMVVNYQGRKKKEETGHAE